MSETTKDHGLGLAVQERRGELAISAMAAKSKAEVEARYVVAMNRPRNIMDVRTTLLDACKRPRFAESARYKKPRSGGNYDEGFSIRFAEMAIQTFRNINVESSTIWEDSENRTVRVTVTDLESNTGFSKDIILAKTVERKNPKQGTTVVGQRKNSYGETVSIVLATEDELANKTAAQESKIIRNCGLRLIPQDILEECEEVIAATVAKGGYDTKAEIKKICDAFNALGVIPSELEKYLGHSLNIVTSKDLVNLRGVYSAIKEDEITWVELMKQQENREADKAPEAKKPEPQKVDPVKDPHPPENMNQEPPSEMSVVEKLRAECHAYAVEEYRLVKMMLRKGKAPRDAKKFEELTDENQKSLLENFGQWIKEVQ